METQREIQKNATVYNFDTIAVDGKPEVLFKCLKRLVGERGFEPPTPWSRTRCSTRLSHSPTDDWRTATTGTMRRLELRQYSILRSGDLWARRGCYNLFDRRLLITIKTF